MTENGPRPQGQVDQGGLRKRRRGVPAAHKPTETGHINLEPASGRIPAQTLGRASNDFETVPIPGTDRILIVPVSMYDKALELVHKLVKSSS